jgi:hypothetical protein
MRALTRWTRRALVGAVLLAPVACGGDPVPPVQPPPDTISLPLPQLGTWNYHGVMGGLYPGGFNLMPSAHATVGALRAQRIRPLNAAGTAAADGRIGVLGIGNGNARRAFGPFAQVTAGQADLRPEVRFANGARTLHEADAWDSATRPAYAWVRDSVLAPAGLTEQQVQVVWLKVANPHAAGAATLPAQNADALLLLERLGNTARALQQRYPNLQQLYLSSPVWRGHAASGRHEPYAYEAGFAVRMLIEAQIRQVLGEGIDRRAGDLGEELAPWVSWGPYLWARGTESRWDGLAWLRADFEADGLALTPGGAQKVAGLLVEFFRSTPSTRCWMLSGLSC